LTLLVWHCRSAGLHLPQGHILLVRTSRERSGKAVWGLPVCAAGEEAGASILDVCNVLGDAATWAAGTLGVALPWLSWLQVRVNSLLCSICLVLLSGSLWGTVMAWLRAYWACVQDLDLAHGVSSGARPHTGVPQEGRCRLFAHRLQGNGSVQPPVPVPHRWLTPTELAGLSTSQSDCLECSGAEVGWLHMWREEEDEAGQKVTRSFGFAGTPGQEGFRYNSAGNHSGVYRVGVFDADGVMIPDPPDKIGESFDSAGNTRWG
jgi:hypothetical protein